MSSLLSTACTLLYFAVATMCSADATCATKTTPSAHHQHSTATSQPSPASADDTAAHAVPSTLGSRTGATQAVHALEYSYDALKRLTQVELNATTVESYAYSDNNNLLQSIVDGTTTNYVQSRFSEPVQRTAPHGQEQLVWDDKGRLARRDMPRASGDRREDRWTYDYDGAGRLMQVRQQVVTPTSPPLPQVVSTTATSSYAYDVDDNLVHETHDMGSVARFAGIRVDTRPGGELLVKVLPGVTVVEPGSAPDVRWSFIEYDGHALETADSSNTRASFELLGGYGAVLVSAGDPLPTDRFHGSDPDLGMGVVPMGVRHITETDGLWLQPEPLLYLGMTNGDVSNPRAYTGVYAAGNPINLRDETGFSPGSGWGEWLSSKATEAYNSLPSTADVRQMATDMLAPSSGATDQQMEAIKSSTSLKQGARDLVNAGATREQAVEGIQAICENKSADDANWSYQVVEDVEGGTTTFVGTGHGGSGQPAMQVDASGNVLNATANVYYNANGSRRVEAITTHKQIEPEEEP